MRSENVVEHQDGTGRAVSLRAAESDRQRRARFSTLVAGKRHAEMIDTLAYTKHLEESGFDRRQAEALAEAVNRYIVPDLATSQDITQARQDLAQETRALRQDLAQETRALRQDLTNLETRLLAAIHTAQFQSIGVVAALIGLALAVGKLL